MEKLKLIIFATFFIMLGCQSETSEAPKHDKTKPTTFASFYVRYLQSDQKANAEARFSSGMTEESASSIKIDNGVFFHNGNMRAVEIESIGTRYSYDFEGPFSESFAFRFEDPLNGKMEHVVSIPTISDYSFSEEISAKNGLKLTWQGTPLAKNESLILLINVNNKLSSLQVQGPTKETKVDITGEKMKGVQTGEATVYLVRKVVEEKELPNFKSINDLEFYTQEKTIIISE